MLIHLRRSVIFAIICLVFFGFVYAFAGTGVSQLLFKHQADGSITPTGRPLSGRTGLPKPGHPGSASSTAAPTTPAPTRPTQRRTSPGATTPWWQTATAASPAATNLGPRSKVLLDQHQGARRLLAQAGRRPDPGPRDHLGQRLRPRHHAARRHRPDPHGRQGHRHRTRDPADRSSPRRPTARNSGFLGSSYIDVLQLNEALAQLE